MSHEIPCFPKTISVEFHLSIQSLNQAISESVNVYQSSLFYDAAIASAIKEVIVANFPHSHALDRPEEFKNWKGASSLLEQVVLPRLDQGRLTFVALGGGALGDLVGFIASLVRRGSPLILIPSTWLGAVDSAHGGKNAINFDQTKNALGSYHFPERVLICQEILMAQPEVLARDAWSEFFKMAIIDSARLYERSIQVFQDYGSVGSLAQGLWQLLPEMIEAKYRVVRQDPFEQKGVRQVLNLGHTLGHALEGALGLSHGYSVALGIRFAEILSRQKGFLQEQLELPGIPTVGELIAVLKKAPPLEKWLGRDKKSLQPGSVDFVFIRKAGHVHPQRTPISEILQEIERLKAMA